MIAPDTSTQTLAPTPTGGSGPARVNLEGAAGLADDKQRATFPASSSRLPVPLDEWARARADRCSSCGWHVESQGHAATCAPSDEWDLFVSVLRKVADDEATVHQAHVRPHIRGRVTPKHIGSLYRRAVAEGVLTRLGHEESDDVLGRNAGRLEPYYRLERAA